MNELLTTRQVQDHLQIDRTTVYRMLKDGRLTGVKVGNQWRFPRKEIEALLSDSSLPGSELSHKYPDSLPIDCLQAIQDVSAEIGGIGAVVTDLEGHPLTRFSNSCRFCSLVLGSRSGRRACMHTWRTLARSRSAQPHFLTCHAGSQCVGAPVNIAGLPTALIIVGQFHSTPYDAESQGEKLRQLAQEHGLSLDELMEAAGETVVMGEDRRRLVVHWVEKLAETLALIGRERADMLDRLRRIAAMSAVAVS